jgi:hypothetical protein
MAAAEAKPVSKRSASCADKAGDHKTSAQSLELIHHIL